MDNAVQDQENVTPIHDESINIVTSIEEESLIEEEALTIETVSIESEVVPMKNESVSLVLDDHLVESFSSTSEEEKTILHVSTIVNSTNGSTALITNSSNVHIDRSLMHLYMPDQFFTHTVPCLDNEMNMSFVKHDVETSADMSLDHSDSKELPPVGHDDAYPILSSITSTSSITAVFFASIIIWSLAVHCWALLIGIINCLKSTTLGRAPLTSRSIVDTLKRAAVLMMTIISFLRYGMSTTTSLIRILLLPIGSLLNIPRWISYVYGPSSYGRSVFDIMFNSNPKQGRKRCKVALFFNAIIQGLLDTGQASLLKMTSLLFTSARLVQVLAIISYVLVRSVAVSISKDVGDCLYHVRAFIFGMARRTYALAIISYAIVHSVAASIFKAVGGCLYHVQSTLDDVARHAYILIVISYTIVHMVAASISETVRDCLYQCQASTFGMARRIQVSIIISYVLARSVAVSILNDVGGCLYHIKSPLFGILLVPHWYWKEFGPYSQGRSVFDILFKSNPRHRLKRGGLVTSSRLNNMETYTYHQYLPWHIYKQFDTGISSTIHRARSCIAMVNEILWKYWLYIRVSFAAVYFHILGCRILAIRRSLVGRSMSKFHTITILATIKCIIIIGMVANLTLDVSAAHYTFQ